MTENNPIDAWIEKVRQGDLDAYADVVRETQDRLRSYILWSCPDPDAVDDLAQEVYIYAYRNLDKYQTGTNFLAWLKQAAHFRVLNRAQSVSARAHREESYFEELMLAAAARTEPPEGTDERIVFLRECLGKLSESSMDLIRGRYEKNLDANELAKLIKKSSAAIRVALLRIREQLRRCVESKISTEGVLP
jgi:RNA polymerase sigma-70 factor (ECF subfamily)